MLPQEDETTTKSVPPPGIVRDLVTEEQIAISLRNWRNYAYLEINATNTAREYMTMIPIECGRRISTCGCVAHVYLCTARYWFGASKFWQHQAEKAGYLTLEIKKCEHGAEVNWGYDQEPPGEFSLFTQPYFDFDRADYLDCAQ